MRLRIAWDRSALTVDLTRTPTEASPDEHPGTEYVPGAQVEKAEPRRVGFDIDPPTRLEPEERR